MGSLGRDWDGISRFYRDQAPKSEMLDALSSLVEKLRVDGFPEAGPFGVTSMWDLCLGLSPDILDHPHLVIVVSDLPHRLEYRRAGSRVEWNRPVDPKNLYPLVRHFLSKQARWFTGQSIGTD